MLTQSCGGTQYTRFPLLNIYVNKHKGCSLTGCTIVHREIFVPKASFCVSLGSSVCCRCHGCFFHQEAQNKPFECYCFVSPIHTDELCNSMRIGRLYRVIGFPAHVHQRQSISRSVEANNVHLWEPECKASSHFRC